MQARTCGLGLLAWLALAACSETNGNAMPKRDAGDAAKLDATPDATSDATRDANPEASVDASTAGHVDAGLPDLAPSFSAKERAALATLRYDPGPPPNDPSNHFADDPAARAFGQRMFFDRALSGRLIEADNDGSPATLGHAGEAGRVSCAGCHIPTTSFVDTRSPHQQISLAAQWTTRRTPTLLEVAFAPLYNWDGRRDALWNQATGVMESEKEFNSGRLFVALQVFRLHRKAYEAVFGAMPALDDPKRFAQLSPEDAGCIEKPTASGATFVCHGKPGDGAEYDALAPADQVAVTRVMVNVAKATSAYVRLLRCGESRFDSWLDGDKTALSPSEQRGAQLFVGRAQCASCHSGRNFSDGKFHNVGLSPAQVAIAFVDAADRGAAAGFALALKDPLSTSGVYSDGDRAALPSTSDARAPKYEGAFRTPTLRCMNKRPSFMHTAQIRTAEQVMAFFNRGGDPAGSYPGTNELKPLGLRTRESADLVAFMAALEGPGPDAALLTAPP